MFTNKTGKRININNETVLILGMPVQETIQRLKNAWSLRIASSNYHNGRYTLKVYHHSMYRTSSVYLTLKRWNDTETFVMLLDYQEIDLQFKRLMLVGVLILVIIVNIIALINLAAEVIFIELFVGAYFGDRFFKSSNYSPGAINEVIDILTQDVDVQRIQN